MSRIINMTIILAVLWLVLSGQFKPLFLGFGLASVWLVVWLGGRMQVIHPESHPVRYLARIVRYWMWLLIEIIRSNVEVTRAIFRPASISPRVIKVSASQSNDLDRVIHANSITLTPGTVSLELHPDSIDVHALTEASAEALLSGTFDRKIPNTGDDKAC